MSAFAPFFFSSGEAAFGWNCVLERLLFFSLWSVRLPGRSVPSFGTKMVE